MNITATLTRCRHNNALVQLESGPFNGMEIRPAELRRMAQQLIAVADMAERLPLGGKHWKPTRVEIGGDQQPSAKLSDAAVTEVFNGIFGGKKQ